MHAKLVEGMELYDHTWGNVEEGQDFHIQCNQTDRARALCSAPRLAHPTKRQKTGGVEDEAKRKEKKKILPRRRRRKSGTT